jgi:hypothetical protein
MTQAEQILLERRRAVYAAGHARGFEEGIAAAADVIREVALGSALSLEQKEVLVETANAIHLAFVERTEKSEPSRIVMA